jgi:hypothetical protein
MIIVIEGVDRTGKTTLARDLAEMIDGTYMHWGAPEHANWYDEYLAPLEGHDDDHLVIDRHYLGELIWPRILGRDAILSETQADFVAHHLVSLGAVGVLATRDPADLELACLDEPCVGRASEAQGAFLSAAQHSPLPFIHYQHGDRDRVIDVLELARLHEIIANER